MVITSDHCRKIDSGMHLLVNSHRQNHAAIPLVGETGMP